MSTENKRVSQLVELTANEVQPADLFLIIDTTAQESKRIQASELSTWLNLSGSNFVPNAINAQTASFVLGSNVFGSVNSSNTATSASTALLSNQAASATSASNALSASYALTASFALNGGGQSVSASFLNYSGVPNGTASYAVNAANANASQTSNFLSYFGGNNGTASYAITTQNVSHATTADTASFFNNITSIVASASYAINASTAAFVTNANTAAFLQYSGIPNGTASYALAAGSIGGTLSDYGLVLAYEQSPSASIIDTVIVSSSLATPQQTDIEAVGSFILSFTSSNITNYSLSLVSLNRLTGETVVLDSSKIGFNTTPMISTWGNYSSGTLHLPFELLGTQLMYGKYLVEVTSSSPYVSISPSRTTRFSFSSKSNILTTQPDEFVDFFVDPSASVVINFSSSLGGPFHDQLPGLLQTGSNNITWMDLQSQNVDDIRYTWKCTSLTTLNCFSNPSLQTLIYSFPTTLTKLQCYSCSINFIVDLDNTALSYFDCNTNNLISVPELSPSTSYLNFSNNPVTSMPSFIPNALQTLYAQKTSISSIPFLPNNIFTASFANTTITSVPNPLPFSMSYLDISHTNVFTMSNTPASMSFLDISNALFSMTGLENASGQLVASNVLSGTLGIKGYGTPSTFSPTLLSNIGVLQSNHWNVLFDM